MSTALAQRPCASFHIEPSRWVHTARGLWLQGDVVTDDGLVYADVTLPPEAWRSRRSFLAALPAAELVWSGDDADVRALVRRLRRTDAPTVQGTRRTGLHGDRWIGPGLALDQDGPVHDPDVVYLSEDEPAALDLPVVSSDAARQVARQALPLLLGLADPDVLLPMLGWFFAAPLRSRMDGFPALWVTGEAAPVEALSKLFGLRGPTRPLPQEHAALASLLASTNAVPVVRAAPQDTLGLMGATRLLYSGDALVQLGAAEWVLTAPLCVLDRHPPMEPGSRVVPLASTGVDARVLRRLRALPLAWLAVPYLRFALGRDTGRDLAVVAARLEAALPAPLPGRRQTNQRALLFGLCMLTTFARAMGVTLPPLSLGGVPVRSLGEEPTDPFERFVWACGGLARRRRLREGTHYAVIQGLTCLDLRACHAVYELEDPLGEVVGLEELRAAARAKARRGRVVRQIGKRVLLDGRRRRTVALRVEAGVFPCARPRTWGGRR
ncbi:MAG: hypothetical protein H6739_37850 [Alphaproteobacteria bacterium]|nr:hypothetical protein [Alphaproteobacteria bacterium]